MKKINLLIRFLFFSLISNILIPITAISSFPLLLVVCFDGFWAGYLEKYKKFLPNLQNISSDGVSAEWMKSVYPTLTLPNLHTIATGSYPETHGIVGNNFYDPIWKETFNYNDSKWWAAGPIPIWISNQLANINRVSGTMMWPGGFATFKNQHKAFYSTPYYSITRIKVLFDLAIEWMTDTYHPANFVLVYIPHLDGTGHKYGPNSAEIQSKLHEIDANVGYLKQRLTDLDLYSKMNILFLSDHGMAEVEPQRILNISSLKRPSYGHSYFGCNVKIYPRPGKEDILYTFFKKAETKFNHLFKVYKRKDIPYEFHYRNNRRIAPLTLFPKQGYLLNLAGSPIPIKGDHGCRVTDVSMRALFVAHGPAFRRNIVVPSVEVIDVYPLMCFLLDIQPEQNNGSLSKMISMLSPIAAAAAETYLSTTGMASIGDVADLNNVCIGGILIVVMAYTLMNFISIQI